MNQEQTSGLGNAADIDPDVLKVLRQRSEYSIADDVRINAFLAEVHESCVELIGSFTDCVVHAGAMSTEMLKVNLQAEENNKFYYALDGDEEKLLFVFSTSSGDFKKILQLALSGKIDGQNGNDAGELTAAETKFMQRVFNQLGENLFANFELLSDRGVPRKPNSISSEAFNALVELEELANVSMTYTCGKGSFSFDLAVPFELLSKEPVEVISPEELIFRSKAERAWKAQIRNSVEGLKVSLMAELVEAELSLNQVSQLEIGDLVDISFGPDPVAITYEDGMKAFLARTELKDDQLYVRVTSGV